MLTRNVTMDLTGSFLDAIVITSPSTYPCRSVSGWVSGSVMFLDFGDGIYRACELVHLLICSFYIFCATTSLQKLIHLQTLNLHHLDIRPRRSFIKFAKASKFTTFPNLCRHISTTNHDPQNTTFQLLVFTLFILTGTVCNTFFSSNIYKRSKYVYQYSEFVKFI